MASRTTQEVRDLMKTLWEQGHTIAMITKLVGLSATTARQYRKRDHWERKREASIVEPTAPARKIAEAAINMFGRVLMGYSQEVCECGRTVRVPMPKAALTAGDFERFIRILRALQTEESRPARVRLDPKAVLP